ncbi:MAG: hypothetical protein Unbinned1007contig1000_52 [Prokaryotic dsDNA virus sp.]|nr:MAG: hypothetical protein Unbinned1007contig1000_52 [Prokaryotic dsDNA virus sp.]
MWSVNTLAMTSQPDFPVVSPADVKQTRILDLTLYKGNPRVHSEIQIERLINSLKKFGFTNPVLIDDTGNVIAGHGRIAAAKKIGLDTVPTITLSHLTEDERKAYIIADNQLALNSSWDDDLLKIELEKLSEAGFDLSVLGWGDDIPTFADEPDYGSLDDFDDPTSELANDVYKAIQIEFRPEDYEEAKEIVAAARKKGVYIGQELVNALKVLS